VFPWACHKLHRNSWQFEKKCQFNCPPSYVLNDGAFTYVVLCIVKEINVNKNEKECSKNMQDASGSHL
jgi:hypothetical protein